MISLRGSQVNERVAYAGKIPAKRQKYLLQFYDRYPRIERANNSLEFQARRVKLMPERRCRKGILLVA